MQITPFGTTKDGREVQAITLQNARLTARLLTLGAILQDLRLDDGGPLTLGAPDLAAYDGGPLKYHGALVGPAANRIAGARASLAGHAYRFDANENGQTTLHGGSTGIHAQVWHIAEVTETSATLTLDLPDGMGGFPGNRRIEARFALDETTLKLEVTATTDAATWINVANHSYWNLDGGNTTEGHILTIPAQQYLPVDDLSIPLAPTSVAGTGFDLQQGMALGPKPRQPLDHNFCMTDGAGQVRPVCTLTAGDLAMTVESDQPGLQIYDAARNDSAPFHGHNGKLFGPHSGVAIEAQGWPDAPNRPDFPSVRLDPGQTYRQTTCWRFTRR